MSFFRSSVTSGAISAAHQQRAQENRMRFSLMETEMAGCRKCGDPVLSCTDGRGGRVYLESGRGWGIEVITNTHGRKELLAVKRFNGSWMRHECRAKDAS